MASTISLPVKTMIKEIADHQARQNGKIVLLILTTLEMVYVLITSKPNQSAIMIVGTVVISPCWPMEIVKNSTTFLHVKTMTKETADIQASQNGQIVPSTLSTLEMVRVLITSKPNQSAITMVVTVAIKF